MRFGDCVLVLLGFAAPLGLLSCGTESVNSSTTADVANGAAADAALDESVVSGQDRVVDFMMDHDETVRYLANDFEQLPEQQIAISEDSTLYAQYARPTDRYGHGILGDAIEAGQLVVVKGGISYVHTLDEQYVFEDLRPRLYDVDGDGQLELITIRTHVARGAGVMIYKIQGDSLSEFAWVEEIGTPSRWLNIAAIYDLDGDDSIELAWIQTPHIGGILRIARISRGELRVIAEASQYSNHAIGQRNLCLSVVSHAGAAVGDAATLYVPTQDRQQIVGFQFTGNSIQRTETIDQRVDFSQPLASQYGFTGLAQGGDNCTRP
jgi:hypothetical protein